MNEENNNNIQEHVPQKTDESQNNPNNNITLEVQDAQVVVDFGPKEEPDG